MIPRAVNFEILVKRLLLEQVDTGVLRFYPEKIITPVTHTRISFV